MAEVECQTTAEVQYLHLPPFAVKDVTEEHFFTGGHLVTLTPETLHEALGQWL